MCVGVVPEWTLRHAGCCVFPLILTPHTRHRPVEQGDWAAGHALTRVHEEASAHSEELRWEPAKVRRPHLSQTLPRLPFPCWLWAQQTQRWDCVIELHRSHFIRLQWHVCFILVMVHCPCVLYFIDWLFEFKTFACLSLSSDANVLVNHRNSEKV